ncbi:hypothetical protein C1646_738881 [Rhizophagus diaphanus]|nr:hypothetical protein C1646_738881 [Rhizophagus diaphanus] [Rhizophagus sp. MUCL 43196]
MRIFFTLFCIITFMHPFLFCRVSTRQSDSDGSFEFLWRRYSVSDFTTADLAGSSTTESEVLSPGHVFLISSVLDASDAGNNSGSLATKVTVQRSRKPKTNDFVSALGMVLEKYNLSVDSTPEQLSEHAKLELFFPIGKPASALKTPLEDAHSERSR